MKAFLVLALAVVACQALPHINDDMQDWLQFKQTHQKTYSNPQEEKHRMNIFLDNKKRITEHNARFQQGLETFTVKINKFADLLSHEFVTMMNGVKPQSNSGKVYVPKGGAPSTKDWRDNKGVVSGVKDQAQCGSCWAFSATGSIEGQTMLHKNKAVSLSEQQLVDCSGKFGNEGCNGGLMDSAFEYIEEVGGIMSEKDYPYTASDGKCKADKKKFVVTVTGFVDISSGDESALQDAVANVGPISVAIDASQFSFQFYNGGVYNEKNCSPTFLDHGVLAVGYGSENGKDYWLVKNSWGGSWGDQGYIKMSRNKNNQCGIATQASYPTVV